MELNSSKIFSGVDHSDARSLLYATGHLPENIGKKPLIGVVNTFNEIVPGHFHLRGIADAAKQGVLMAGGKNEHPRNSHFRRSHAHGALRYRGQGYSRPLRPA